MKSSWNYKVEWMKQDGEWICHLVVQKSTALKLINTGLRESGKVSIKKI
jgi:hypothetical protein